MGSIVKLKETIGEVNGLVVEAIAWYGFICNGDIGFWLAIDIDLHYCSFFA